MKKIFLLFFAAAAISVTANISATLAQTRATYELPRHLDPSVVSVGKELPRGDVTSHDSREEAIRKVYHSSKYLQPLTEWTRSESAETVTYKTRYKIPFEWIDREQFLYLGKVSASFDVIVNGDYTGYSQTGSTPSEFDITAVSREGNNELEIVIYKEPVAAVLENSRPASEPQITGEAYVLSQPKMRVRDIVVDTGMEGTDGLLELGVIMKNHQLNAKDYRVWYELLSPKGEVISEGYKDATLDMRREDTVRFFSRIHDIMPWSHEEPRLYTLYIKTQNEGRFREHLLFRIGFRDIELRDGLVYLTGTPLKMAIKEFTPSSDMTAMRSAVEALRTEGFNTLELKGAPPSREFYALCDELGVYLCNQADIDTRLSGDSRRIGGNPSNDPVWEAAYRDRVMAMYHTSKNYPSIAMFSIAEKSANGYNLYESYLALKAVEHQRPVIYTDGGEWNNDRLDTEAMKAIHYVNEEKWAIITPENVTGGQFRVHNTRHFTPILGEAVYKIAVGNRIVSRGSVPLEVLPKGATDFVIPIKGVKEGKKFVVQIEVEIEKPVNKYVLDNRTAQKKVFRDTGTVADRDKIVIERRSFPSGRMPATVRDIK
jgi:beta-galactosidase